MHKTKQTFTPTSLFFLIFLRLASPVSVYAQDSCSQIFALADRDAARALAQQAWSTSNFTTAAHFDPRHFRLIVHAGPHVINGAGDRDVLDIFLERSATHDLNTERFFSASIVSEKQTATFNRAGLILEVPEQKIVAATSDDMRSCIGDCKKDADVSPLITDFFKREGLKSPQDILNASAQGTGFYSFGLDWTEVLINGTAVSPRPIRITGLFAHQDSLGEIVLTREREKILRSAAERMKLPLIFFPPPSDRFVLKVRMTRQNRSGPFASNGWGPQGIEFLQTRAEVEDVFRQAQGAGQNVTLVDESNGPPPINAPAGFLDGAWLTRIYDTMKENGITMYKERLILLGPTDLPAGVPPISFVFKN